MWNSLPDIWGDFFMKKIAAALLAVVVSGLPAHAASILDPYFDARQGCYARFYDEAHLRDNPRQMVESITLYRNGEFQDPGGELTLSFDITTRDGKWYEGTGICIGNRCGVEGDGGSFTLVPYRDGLLLEVDGRAGMHAEGPDGFIALEETDDTEFLLYAEAGRTCQQ
jgi:hypothetical protein